MAKTSSPRYKPHPMLQMEQRAKDKLEADTGKTFDAWLRFARAKGPSGNRDLVAWLRKEHGFTSMQANWLAQSVTGEDTDYGDPEPLVDALYAGAHARLRPIHEAVVDVLNGLGPDVCVTACKTMVPAYRKHVFAELRPTPEGVLLRMALGDVPRKGRLEAYARGTPDDRLTHAVTLRAKQQIDAELKAWLAQAYALGSGAIARSTSFSMPPGLKQGLARSKPASATWASMTPAMQRDMATWISAAKQAETQARRLATVLGTLASGKKRVY